MLTPRQRELLSFVHERMSSGPTPSYNEIGEALGLRSKSNVARLVDGLVERGFLRKTASRHRSIEIVKLPAGPRFEAVFPETVKIPFMGTVSPEGITPPVDQVGGGFPFTGIGLPTDIGLSAVRVHGGGLASLDLVDDDVLVFAKNRRPVVGSYVLVRNGAMTVVGRVLEAARPWVVGVVCDGHMLPLTVPTVEGVAVNLLRRYICPSAPPVPCREARSIVGSD